jgi:hypothetical protein
LTSATVMADVWSLILATRRSPVKSSLGLCGRGVDAESDECLHNVLVGLAVEEIPSLWGCCTHEQLQQYRGLNRALEPKNLDSSATEAECLVGNKNQSLHCIVPARNQSNCPRRTPPPTISLEPPAHAKTSPTPPKRMWTCWESNPGPFPC